MECGAITVFLYNVKFHVHNIGKYWVYPEW